VGDSSLGKNLASAKTKQTFLKRVQARVDFLKKIVGK
jgi:hypothetical protein